MYMNFYTEKYIFCLIKAFINAAFPLITPMGSDFYSGFMNAFHLKQFCFRWKAKSNCGHKISNNIIPQKQ